MLTLVLLVRAPHSAIRFVVKGPVPISTPAPDPWSRWRRWAAAAGIALMTGVASAVIEDAGRALIDMLG